MCLSSAARSRYSAGEILNIVTTDVQRLRNFWWSSRDILYCPLMVSVALVGLYIELGWSVCFGIVILITVLPVNFGSNNFFL